MGRKSLLEGKLSFFLRVVTQVQLVFACVCVWLRLSVEEVGLRFLMQVGWEEGEHSAPEWAEEWVKVSGGPVEGQAEQRAPHAYASSAYARQDDARA